jgi:DNA end-binding protein Ku
MNAMCGRSTRPNRIEEDHPMAPRAYWKGYLRLSLVSCPVQLFPATSERRKIRLHQINKRTGHRIKYCKLDADTDERVDDDDVVMGYELSKGKNIQITNEELEAISIEGSHTIEIDRLVPRTEIDDVYLNRPYYIAPDGEIGRQAYAVIREAIKREQMVALGTVILTTREHVIAIEPHGAGLLGVTLRYPYEIYNEAAYFADLRHEKVPKEMLDLATHIIASKAGHFDPEAFEDHYEGALKALIKKKLRGETIEKPRKRAPAQEINLMDALRQSVARDHSTSRAHGRSASTRHKRTIVKRPVRQQAG